MTRARWALIASLLAISALSSACAGSDHGPSSASDAHTLTADQAADRYGYDINSATTSPVYAIIPEYNDPRDTYARQLLARACLKGVLDYPATPPAPVTPDDAFDPRTAQRIFNVTIASRWGYQLPPRANTGATATETVSPEVQSKKISCGDEADKRLGLPPAKPVTAIEDAGWAAVDTDSGVASAATGWQKCMSPVGIIDLPSNPHDMPSPSVVTPGSRGTDAQGNQVSNGAVGASARERQVAVADATCRAQVGFDAAELAARARAELTAIGHDVEGFESARRQYKQYEKGVDKVIEEMGG